MDHDDDIATIFDRHSARLDMHALGKLPASQLRLLHGDLLALCRARRPNVEADPNALARAAHAAETTLDALEAHPEVVSAAADRIMRASADDQIDAAAGGSPQRPPAAASSRAARPLNMSPRARASVANIRAAGGARITADDLREHLGDAARDVLRGAAGRRRVATIEASGQITRLGEDPSTNERLIASACAERGRALRASGGICSPSAAVYDLPMLATDARPVRDALVQFVADRGGVRFIGPPTLSDVAAGVSVWTAANDANPSSPTTKPTVTLTCGQVQEVLVNAITQSVKVGNFRQRYFPEQVDAWLRALSAEHARVAELALLTTMSTGSINAVTNAVLGASRDVLTTIDRAASAYRSRQRLAPDEILTFIAPAWLRDLVRVDLTRESFTEPSELSVTYAQIDAMLASRNVSPVWSLDWEPAAAQADGLLDGWQSTCPALLFHPSSWLFLDGGELNIGVVRDATLVGTNDFLIFSESMENVAMRGIESLLVTMTLCPDGSTSAPVDITGTVCPQGS